MHHPDTKKFLGFSATEIEEAKAKRKEHLSKLTAAAALASNPDIKVGDYVKMIHNFNKSTYSAADQWREQEDLNLTIGDSELQPWPAILR